jgi:hypothetical protein
LKLIQIKANVFYTGVPPRHTVTFLQQTTEKLVILQDVYNLKKEFCCANLEGRAATDALLARLKEQQIHHCVVINRTTSWLSRLFVAMPESLKHLAQNPNVLLMDATYKTNRFNMPLVDTVRIDNCFQTFFISFAFMSSEAKLDYKWSTQCNLELFTMYMPSIKPSIIATDADLALIAAVGKTFPRAVALLCT